jgi:hypothetical protein
VEIFIFCSSVKSLYSTQAHIEAKSSNFTNLKISPIAFLSIQQFLNPSTISQGFLFKYGSFNSNLALFDILEINHSFSYQTLYNKSDAISGV